MPGSRAAGFTLVELMVVLMLMSVLLVLTTSFGNRSMELIGQISSRAATDRIAAAAFEQLARDLDQRVVRREVTLRVEKNEGAGDDELVLITRRSGLPLEATEADRQVATVHYRVDDHDLWQGAAGCRFGQELSPPAAGTGMLEIHGLPDDGPEDLPLESSQPLAAGVLRMEMSFVVSAADGSSRVQAAAPVAPDRAEALVVQLVVLDPDRSRMIDAAQRSRIAAEFKDSKDNEIPGESWRRTALELGGRAESLAVPAVALRQVRVYQRRFSLATPHRPS